MEYLVLNTFNNQCQVVRSGGEQLWCLNQIVKWCIVIITDVYQTHISVYLLLLHSLLTTPSVGVQPEELLLALLVAHHLLWPGAGAAHQRGHGSTWAGPGLLHLGLGHHSVGAGAVGSTVTIVSSHWMRSHAWAGGDHCVMSLSALWHCSPLTDQSQESKITLSTINTLRGPVRQHCSLLNITSECSVRACAVCSVRGMKSVRGWGAQLSDTPVLVMVRHLATVATLLTHILYQLIMINISAEYDVMIELWE